MKTDVYNTLFSRLDELEAAKRMAVVALGI